MKDKWDDYTNSTEPSKRAGSAPPGGFGLMFCMVLMVGVCAFVAGPIGMVVGLGALGIVAAIATFAPK